MKKILAILLTLTMIVGLAASAMAATISVSEDATYENGAEKHEYKVFKIFDADVTVTSVNAQGDTETIYILATTFDENTQYYVYDDTEEKYVIADPQPETEDEFAAESYYTAVAASGEQISYSLDPESEWLEILWDTDNDVATAGNEWFTLALSANGDKYVVTLNDDVNPADDEVAKDIAAWLKEQAEENSIEPTTTLEAGESVDVNPGYYLVYSDDDNAANLMLVTADAEIIEKNSYLSDNKVVETSNLKIGEEAVYYIEVYIPNGTDPTIPVTVHDILSEYLEFEENTLQVTAALAEDPGSTAADYKALSYNELGTAYDVKTGDEVSETEGEKCTFEIQIDTTDLIGKYIVFTYKAVLLETALDDDGFINKEFSSTPNYNTVPSEPIVYTFDFELEKIFKDVASDSENAEDYEATFNLYPAVDTYTADESGTWYKLLTGEYTDVAPDGTNDDEYEMNNGTPVKYLKTTSQGDTAIKFTKEEPSANDAYDIGYYVDPESGSVDIVVTAADVVDIRGLDAGVYYLVETATAEGFNPLTVPVIITIIDESDLTTVPPTIAHTVTYQLGEDGDPQDAVASLDEDTDKVSIVNNYGTVLPSTGGIGTTIFYVLGGLMAVGAGVVLVTKKRMGKVED